jgi:hypothetical protein
MSSSRRNFEAADPTAPAGAGKSRLLTAAGYMARGAHMRILAAGGAEHERELPFGLALKLFEQSCSLFPTSERDGVA